MTFRPAYDKGGWYAVVDGDYGHDEDRPVLRDAGGMMLEFASYEDADSYCRRGSGWVIASNWKSYEKV